MNTNNFWGIMSLVTGLGLIGWGVSYFIFPALLFIIGFMLVSHGLRMRNMPPLNTIVVRILSQMRD